MSVSEPLRLSLGAAKVWAFLRLGRPQFLLGAFALYGLGALLASAAGAHVHAGRYWLGQAVVTGIQVMTNYSNDYFDIAADAANRTPTRWSGGSRVLTAGELPPWVALATALVAAALALAAMLALAFVAQQGPLTFALMPAMLALAWAYSAPPFRLHSRGVGELVATLVVAVFVPWLGFVVQTGALTRLPVLAVVPLALLQFAMLLNIELPDREGDAAVGKRTLVVRLGVGPMRALHHASLLGSYLLLPLLVLWGLPARVALGVACTAPLAVWQLVSMRRAGSDDSDRWERSALLSVALIFGGTLAELLALASA